MSKGGFPSDRFSGSNKDAVADRSIVSFKELTIEEHMALQMYLAFVRSPDCCYNNREDEDGNTIHGEERYAIDSVLGARYLLQCLGMSDKELKARYDEIDEALSDSEEEDD